MKKLDQNDIELYLKDSLAKLDLSDVEESQQEVAIAFAQVLSSSVAGLTSNFLAGNWEINSQQKMISNSLYLGSHLYAVASPLLFLPIFEWLWETIKSLFDDEGLDLTFGKTETEEGGSTFVGVGVEVNIDPEDDESSPPQPTQPPSSFPVEFDGVPKKPAVQLKVMVGYNTDSLLDSLPDFPPPSLPDLTFPTPTFDPGESGVIFGIEFNF